jgi:predicted DNA-binding WGR domain protein
MTLRRRDPARRMARFYRVGLQAELLEADLLGGWSLVREWGRIGSPGTVRADRCATEADARAVGDRAIARKQRRGYASAAPWG